MRNRKARGNGKRQATSIIALAIAGIGLPTAAADFSFGDGFQAKANGTISLGTAIRTESADLKAVDADPPDVVMTDIRMPPTQTDEGMQVAERLRLSHPQIGVVVLSQHGSAQERGLTQRAVEKHVSEIFGRLGLGGEETISRRVHATLIYLGQREA